MTNRYVRSTDGNEADNGTTWALANATLAGSISDSTAGDPHYVSDNHAETSAGTITLSFKGTITAPDVVICGDDSAEPPTATATSATVTTTGGNIDISGHCYVYGIKFIGNVTASGVYVRCNANGDAIQTFESCAFEQLATNASPRISVGAAVSSFHRTLWKDCTVKFGNAEQSINAIGVFDWEGGSIVSGSSAITTLFQSSASSGRGRVIKLSGVDLSNAAQGLVMVEVGTDSAAMTVTLKNCKLPTSWNGSLFASAPTTGLRCEMYNCDSGDTNYRLLIEDYAGTISSNTSISYNSGVDDGSTQAFSWEMNASANAEFPLIVLRSPEIVKWNETVGSAVTVTVEFLINSATTLYKEDVWLEVEYLGTSTRPLSLFDQDSKLGLLAAKDTTECDTGAGVANWTGDGAGAKSYKLVSTITPQEKGYIHARVCLAVDQTIYVDPLLTVA